LGPNRAAPDIQTAPAGHQYESKTGYFYDPDTRYFYDDKIKMYLYYENEAGAYIAVDTNGQPMLTILPNSEPQPYGQPPPTSLAQTVCLLCRFDIDAVFYAYA
jgi:hypothetical protein